MEKEDDLTSDKYKTYSIKESAEEELMSAQKSLLKVVLFFVTLSFISFALVREIEVFVLPFIIVMLLFIFYLINTFLIYWDRRRKFWDIVASIHDWDLGFKFENEANFLFGKGKTFSANYINGKFADAGFHIFELVGRRSPFTAFVFELDKKFPHCYLDRKDNKYSRTNELIPLTTIPPQFAKFYELHVPKKYEIELLQIFNINTLAYLLDSNTNYDVELYENKLIIIHKHRFDSVEEFEIEIQKVEKLYNQMKGDLKTFSYSKIGDLSPMLDEVKVDQYKRLYGLKKVIFSFISSIIFDSRVTNEKLLKLTRYFLLIQIIIFIIITLLFLLAIFIEPSFFDYNITLPFIILIGVLAYISLILKSWYEIRTSKRYKHLTK
ncbi:MAG: hypothetical protein R3B60_04650 [Candidatus Paceibacterota bacterium]